MKNLQVPGRGGGSEVPQHEGPQRQPGGRISMISRKIENQHQLQRL